MNKLTFNANLRAHVPKETPLYDLDRIRALQNTIKQTTKEAMSFLFDPETHPSRQGKIIVKRLPHARSEYLLGRTYLVRGIGKRAVVVHRDLFDATDREVSDEMMVIMAAQYAIRQGWKTIYVFPDDEEGMYAEVTNHAMRNEMHDGHRSGGEYLCYVGHRSEDKHKYKPFTDISTMVPADGILMTLPSPQPNKTEGSPS